MNWSDFLKRYQKDGAPLLSEALMERWGSATWEPSENDRKAAGKLHTQVASRITTQRLGYLDGDEKTALDSVYALFEKTRNIVDEFHTCRHFDTLAWDVLNTHVRPFTAKWHRESLRGVLSALDATDEFRAQLSTLQKILREFDDLLIHLRDNSPPPAAHDQESDAATGIVTEMHQAIPWGIPKRFGGIDDDAKVTAINDAERVAIRARRVHYLQNADKAHAVALALSGGGIRSATFSLGVLVALAKRGVLPQIDYLSTVSGGGYLGSFLSTYLTSPNGANIGLSPDKLPFHREAGEAEALRYIRHHSKYLATGSSWQRAKMVCGQLYGMLLNGLAIVFLITCGVGVERWIRSLSLLDGTLTPVTIFVTVVLAVCAIVALLLLRFQVKGWRQYVDALVAFPTAVLVMLLVWRGLGSMHAWVDEVAAAKSTWSFGDIKTWMAIGGTVAGAIPIITSALAGTFGRLLKRTGIVLVVMTAIAAPLFLFGIYLVIYYEWSGGPDVSMPFGLGTVSREYVRWTTIGAGLVLYYFLLNINFTSPHRHYRDKLAEAYLIQPSATSSAAQPFDNAVSIPLSALANPTPCRAPYHLINCALNVPGSRNPKMQGRLTDFFLFSPAYSGSPLTGYEPTTEWEKADSHLDLGTAMAISGAAAAPQMGLATIKRLSFWLALLNVRLGYWARKPKIKSAWLFGGAPGLVCLLQEMLGTMDERLPWLNLSDGGHIENLGVYELLRRRCKYIIAVDGEEDSKMTFHAITTLQRLAAIDFGIQIDLNLDDLRLNKKGLTRSHFHFCRVRYPSAGRGSEDMIGYLLYLKLSLTGNEGEFIRRYRLDEPVFPHHSTADQFFSEPQFEAYRSLGEHVGDKLFLRAIVGNLADSRAVNVEEWFLELGRSLLEPLPAARPSQV
jgi:hypothetical protein